VSKRPVERVGPAARLEWDAFVAARPEGDVLQSWAWGEAMACIDQRPIRIGLRGDDARFRGVAQVLVRDAPFGRTVLYAPHGPLWDREAGDADDLLRNLVDELWRVGRAEHAIVVKIDPRASPAGGGRLALDDRTRSEEEPARDRISQQLVAHGLRPARYDLQARSTLIVDLLDGGPELIGTWSPKARYLVRRSMREGAEVRIDRDGNADMIGAFHALLLATAERGVFRPHPLAFLRTLATEMGRDGWYLGIARCGERPIAGMVAVRTGDRAFYLYGATDRDPAVRHANGGYGVMAAVMAALAADGVRSLDLWGVVDENDPHGDPRWRGFSAFKRRFGGTPLRHPGAFDLVIDPFWNLVREARERLRERR
jgi:peptidoglycan pentaglycine glycine transferase (the first glycine)